MERRRTASPQTVGALSETSGVSWLPDKLGTEDVMPCKPIRQWRSQNLPDGKENMQLDHRAVKAGKKKQKNDEASRKPIKHRTDFAVITCKLPHKGS